MAREAFTKRAQPGAEGIEEVHKEGQRTPLHGQPPGGDETTAQAAERTRGKQWNN